MRLAVLGALFVACLPLGAGPAADLATAIRENSLDRDECYRVRDLTLVKDDLRIYLTDGYLMLAILPLGIIGTTMGEFGAGFPVFLAINANMATWLQWVIGSLTLVLSVVWIRVLAEMVARETDVEWTFWGLFAARFMLPHQRARYIERKTRVGVAIPDGTVAVDPIPRDRQPAAH